MFIIVVFHLDAVPLLSDAVCLQYRD